MESYATRLEQLATQFGYEFGVRKKRKLIFGQHNGEFEETNSVVERLIAELDIPVRVLVELGVNWGASLFVLARLAEPSAKIIGVDAGLFPGIDDVHLIFEALRAAGHDACFIHDTTQQAVAKVRAAAPIDLLHIDADHEYAGAKHDWDHYTPMVRRNGIILLHDITYMKGVKRLWQDLRPGLKRFREIETGDRGMAVIVKTW